MKCIVIGDTGTGDKNQYAVANGLTDIIKKEKIKFVLMAGDNFYETGCSDHNDPQFISAFEKPYKNIPNDIKFYACLGNHCIYNESGKGHEAQFEYSRLSSDKNGKFVHPYHFYDFGKKDLFRVFVIDSNFEVLDDKFKKTQSRITCKKIRESTEPWKILMLHTPITSVGEHGNLDDDSFKYVKNIIKNGIDLVVSGHDHIGMLASVPVNNKKVYQIISGNGGKPYFKSNKDKHIHPGNIKKHKGELLHYNTDLGYTMLNITPKNINMTFLNKNNDKLFNHKISK